MLVAVPTVTRRYEGEVVEPQPKAWGTAKFGVTANLGLWRVNAETPFIVLVLTKDGQLVIGRNSPESDVPDIDLGTEALSLGVSRRHCRFRRVDDVIYITDLGSTNGTYLNGAKLERGIPQAIRDGDEMRFGRMIVRGLFQ